MVKQKVCARCRKLKTRKYGILARGKWGYKERDFICRPCRKDLDPIYGWANGTVDRHKARYWKGAEVHFAASDLINYIKKNNITNCEVCHAPLDFGAKEGQAHPLSPSLDRIDPKKAKHDVYLEDIQILCNTCNKHKATLTEEEWIAHTKQLNNAFANDKPEKYQNSKEWNDIAQYYIMKYDKIRNRRASKYE